MAIWARCYLALGCWARMPSGGGGSAAWALVHVVLLSGMRASLGFGGQGSVDSGCSPPSPACGLLAYS